MTKIASNLQIDSARLWGDIHETAKFGATPKGGVRRLTLGPEDKQVRDWFRKACEARRPRGACRHARLDVRRRARAATCRSCRSGSGSHLDTQPTGGKYDGVLGTLAALEVVRTLNDAGIETEAPICICNWTNEEGSRFAPAMMASAAYVGDFTTDDILSRKDAEGVTVGDRRSIASAIAARAAVGTRNSRRFVELHIEQGPILEAENKTIGVVDSGQGVMWYDGRIVGFESHAGSTPMPLRRDALATLSEIVLAMERIAKKHGPERGRHHRRGRDRKRPRAMSFPARSPSPSTCAARRPRSWTTLDKDLRAAIAEIAARRKVEIELDPIWRKPPTHFNPKLVDAVENAAKTLGYSHRRITSGAGHDACNLNTVMPAAMVFVPCKDGISHNELEDATQADCAAGANVLMHTVLALAGVAS